MDLQFGTVRRLTLLVALFCAGAFALSACAPEEQDAGAEAAVQGSNQSQSSGATQKSDQGTGEDLTATPARTQADDCEWQNAAVSPASAPSVPVGNGAELSSIIVGSWQHTHFDTGAGFEAIEGEDIRFVFSSAETMRYCQHVPGVTDHAENATAISWDGTGIVLPNGSVLYEVLAWNDDTMVWKNNMVDSTFLLVRR